MPSSAALWSRYLSRNRRSVRRHSSKSVTDSAANARVGGVGNTVASTMVPNSTNPGRTQRRGQSGGGVL